LKNVVVKNKNTKRLQTSEMMKTHRKDLAIAQEQWEEDAKNNRIVTDNVADVVSMMTGIQ
jgi:ATP-dependent Clp protease ATP-binding subunit ClpC